MSSSTAPKMSDRRALLDSLVARMLLAIVPLGSADRPAALRGLSAERAQVPVERIETPRPLVVPARSEEPTGTIPRPPEPKAPVIRADPKAKARRKAEKKAKPSVRPASTPRGWLSGFARVCRVRARARA